MKEEWTTIALAIFGIVAMMLTTCSQGYRMGKAWGEQHPVPLECREVPR